MKIKQRRNKMKCPHCGFEESKVIDSRPIDDNSSIRRRRECLKCQARFTTYEVIENIQPIVIKKDGSREYFDKNKLLVGLLKACQKRPVDSAKIADEIEQELQNSLKLEITSYQLGEMAMEKDPETGHLYFFYWYYKSGLKWVITEGGAWEVEPNGRHGI
jgi:transcriptional repressor NrdR